MNNPMKKLSVGLLRSGEVERDTALISPKVEIAGQELRALITRIAFGNPTCRPTVQLAPQHQGAKIEPRVDRRRDARERPAKNARTCCLRPLIHPPMSRVPG